MQRRNKIAVSVLGAVYLVVGIVLMLNQEKVIYQPWQQNFEECPAFADAEKVTYRGTRMYVEKGIRGIVILYHGNAGSACDRWFYAEQFLRAGFGYAIVEYTGYSSDGKNPTHADIKEDVMHVASYLEEQGIENEIVIGESIGTGVAAYHVSLRAPSQVLLISPFASLGDLARRRFWFYPTSLMVDNEFDSAALLSQYTGPVTIMHGDNDMIISQKSGLKLFDNLSSSEKRFISIEGRGHNDLFYSQESFEVIQKVLENSGNKD